MKKKEEEKKQRPVYKGVFICNERKKRQGGRIKCPDFPNKIEVFGFNAAIHESEVEWEEIRRYKREDRNKKKEAEKKDKKVEDKSKAEGVKKNNPKFKEKVETKQEKQKEQKKNYEKDGQIKQQKKSQEIAHKNKKPKYKMLVPSPQTKPEIDKPLEKEQSKSTQKELKTKLQVADETKQEVPKEKLENDEDYNRDTERQTEKEESDDEEDSFKDLEIIVGRVKRQTNIIYKTKPFVSIMNFVQKPKNKKKKGGSKDFDNPISQLLQDFYVDIVPIHPRLPVMEMDQLVPTNIDILSEYVFKTINYDKEGKTKELNRIMDSLSSTYIFVTFSDWDGDYPLVKIHKILGKAMTIDGQCERFLYEHGLNDFNYEEKTVQKEPLKLQPSPLHKRMDRMVFTIDPATSTDLDDALSIQKKGNLYQIGIHIADVASYMSLIDRSQIVRRTTSVYLPYKVYHMLESHLVKICSIDPGVERLAFTVWVTMDRDGNVVEEGRLQKNIVKSRFKLSYEVVQNIITGKLKYEEFNQKYECSSLEFDQLQEKLLILTEIAANHRSKRILFDVFENKEIEFKSDQSLWPVECYIDKRFAAKKMIEEYMIIGNVESARFLVKNQPENALIIHHPRPSKLATSSFNEQFKILETKFKFDSVLTIQKQLLELEGKEGVKEEIKKLCYFKARRVMEAAIYKKYNEIMEEEKEIQKEKQKAKKQTGPEVESESHPIVHFALGLQFYTHFTSPMRRMADILVHQILTKVLEGGKPKPIEKEEIEKINNGRRSTKRLKKDLNEVYLCLMIFHTKKPIQTEGIISSFGMESVSIYIPLFDMQKEVMWKKEFKIYSIHRIPKKEDRLDVKLKHDKISAKGDVYWVMKKFEKVKLVMDCTDCAPLKLKLEMEVESEKGPFKVEWIST